MKTMTPFSIRSLASAFTLSGITAGMVAALSLAGIFFPAVFYPTADIRNSSILTDIVNLAIGLPCLLGAMALARRGMLAGLLCWPGMLLFAAYHAIAFAAAVPFTPQFWLYLVLAVLSLYTLVRLLTGLDAPAVRQRLQGRVFERIGGSALIAMGLLFAGLVAQIMTDPASTPSQTATGVADLTIIPLLILGGVLLWRRSARGYIAGAGLLCLMSMLFIGLLAYFILQPVVAGIAFPLDDFVAIAVISLFSIVPFGLFVRGIMHVSL